MFRIESYITSIILSYADRYIKNFRHQDAQVSLWEGDGSFQNLNLDLEVLEQELNLPLSFVSGHIHELLIHVPWTRLASEPVQVTINTIECVMKLKPPGSTPTVSQGEMKSKRLKPEEVPPSSYISSLVNKIICNLSITCNNLILKYVEEDIVLSMNIKTLTLNTVNADWISEFSDLSPSQLILRKLISLSDVTICLDKRNASGRIESYLEPLLYRCNMTVRLSRTYPSANALRAVATHIDIFCEQMAFTLSEPQVPMIMRLIALALALNRKQFTSQTSIATSVDATASSSDTESSDLSETAESWSSWVMSWVPSIYPLVGEDNDDLNSGNTIFQKSTFHFGFYVDTFMLALKLCEQELPTGKCQPNTYLHISLHGCLCDITLLNSTWTNVQMGISEASIQPAGDCCCGTSESNTSQQPYLSCGKIQDSFLDGSLFSGTQNHHDPETICNWDYHLSTLTETILLEKTPAFAIDYMFSSVIPKIYDSEDEEIEKLPPKERVLIRYVAGPMVIRVTSGLIHRIQMIMKAAANYDYNPYGSATQVPTIDKNVLHLSEHLSEGGFDWNEELISCYFPSHVSQFTAFGTKIEFYPANHMPVLQSTLGRKLSRPQKRAQNSMPAPSTSPPCVLFEWMCVYASLTRPYNPDKWLQMANCFESGKLPNEIIATAQTRLAFRVVGVSSSLNISHNQPMKLVEMSSITCDQTCHYLLQRLDREINSDTKAKIGRVTITSSRAKLLLLTNIIHSLVATNNKLKYQRCFNTIYHSSLIKDATKTTETIYLKISVEDINVRRVLTGISETVQFSNGAIQAFMIRLPEKGPEIETMILNAPDVDQTPNAPFLSVIFQYPKENSVYPPVLSFKSRELRLSIDPLLYDWLLYTPISMPTPLPNPKIIKSWKSVDSIKMRKVSESSLSSHPKRAVTPQESVHSSSEKETIPSAHPSSLPIFEAVQPVPVLPISERISSWFPVWKSLVITGDISQWSVYLPNYSLAESTPKSMESSLQDGIKNISRMLQVVVIKLPSTTLQCNSNKENPLDVVGRSIPIALPPSIWSPDKTNFPWILNIKDMQSYTLHGNKRLQLLKPVTVNCTITTSPKFSDDILTSLALCVHLQTFPVIISLSEDQVELLAGLMMNQSRVYNTLSTSWATETVPCEEPVVNVKLISSDESLSTSQPAEESVEGDIQNGVKLTAWFQWLIAKFTLKIYSSPAQNSNEDLKLALDVEDIILSLDVERVYHKIKLKVATASISHYTRKSLEKLWSLGAFKGFVMRGYDPDGVNISSAKKHTPDDATISSGFLTATLTRARCSNLHSKIGSPTKSKSISKKYTSNIEVENSFITEIVVKLQPLDFVLSPAILGTFFHVLDPLVSVTGPGCSSDTIPGSSLPLKFSTSSLPLLYLDLMTIRVMFPTSNMKEKNQHDVLIFQLDKLVVNPQPENPICRNPIRQDIYHAAEKRRILNIPGSEVEDRQYQIDFLFIKVSTGMWYELENVLMQEPTDTVVQNPALDWNEGRSPNAPEPNLLASIISPFNLSLVLAPAILFKNSILVCGHSAEVNGVSEINTKLSLDQLHLCSVLAAETRTVLHTVPKNKQNISVLKMHQFENESVGSIIHNLEFDSGIESVGSSIHTISKRVDQNMAAVHSLTTTGIQIHSPLPSTISHQPYSPLPKPNIVVPIELFVTGSGFNFVLFKKHQLNEEQGVEPLLYVQISQPHLYARRFGETTTSQISIFDLSLRTGKMNNLINNDEFSVKCFPLSIVKTRSGDPNPLTGIPPALLTARLTKANNKSPQLHLDMGRPLRVSISIEILEYFQRMKVLISNSLMVDNKGDEMDKSIQSKLEKLEDLLENEVDMNLQKYLTYFATISANTQQLVLALLSRNEENGGLTVSLSQLTAELSHQQTVSGSATIHNLSIATQSLPGHCPQLLINPWTFCIHTLLSWESWIPVNYSPVINLMVDSEVLRLDFSPDQLWRLQELVTEYDNFYKKQHKKDIEENQNIYEESITSPNCEEQHYHDDLQTGAFQFIDATKAFEGLPQTYQVVFSNGEGSSTTSPTMSWKYPQPRALTKLHIQPIPFTDSITVPSVKCVLQFYNNNQNTYMDYVEFSLSESEVCVVDLPTYLPELVANTTWRVVLGISNFDIPPIPVRALAGSLRVNSYFSPKLVPNIQLDFNFQSIQLSLWSQVSTIRPLPESLSRYFPDGCLPPDQDFLTASMDQTNFCFTLWPNKSRLLTIKTRPRLDVVSYVTLSKQCCVPPFPLMARVFFQSEGY
uniref:Chorein N-terminal domain-containing protein n=1 Tax=Clastoptera arizonana TaxID=38151 RepID=A0A1B6E4J2_9HEMI